MLRFPIIFLTLLLINGCAQGIGRKQVMSSQLPLSIRDFEEIRAGDEAHNKVLESKPLFRSPDLEAYVRSIGMRLARVSGRPYLPYRFFVLDTGHVDIFAEAGGRIYLTRGAFNFIESESELAAVLAHEIGHTSAYRYSGAPEGEDKMKKAYEFLVNVSDQTGGFAGPMGAAGQKGLKTIGRVAPHVRKRFTKEAEVQADNLAVQYLLKAGYDPRALFYFVDKLSKVPPAEVGGFVDLLNSHPPFKKRREALQKNLKRVNYKKAKLPETFNGLNGVTVDRETVTKEVEAHLTEASSTKAAVTAAKTVAVPSR